MICDWKMWYGGAPEGPSVPTKATLKLKDKVGRIFYGKRHEVNWEWAFDGNDVCAYMLEEPALDLLLQQCRSAVGDRAYRIHIKTAEHLIKLAYEAGKNGN